MECTRLNNNECLIEIYDQMLGDTDISSVLRVVADVACANLKAERATVYLVDESTNELQSAAVIGNVPCSIRLPIKESSLAGYCAVTGRSYVVPDAYGDLSVIDERLHFDRSWDKKTQFRTRDVMCTPAMFKGKIMGVIQVLNGKDRSFQESDLNVLKNISHMVGYALYHAKIYDDLATMKKLEMEKARFMQIMVHELKSPVAASKMMTDILKNYKNKPEKMVSLTGRIADRLDQMSQLIKDILELASVKSGVPLGDVSELNIVAETQEHYEVCCDQAKQKGLEMSMEVAEKELFVRFDSQGLSLVLSNIIGNAVKYTGEGSVKIKLSRQDEWAVIEVSDTGIGIPEADIPKLFGEFYRASNARKSNIPGSGVGLAGVKNIIERFGGRLELQSRENEGSIFSVYLPLYSDTWRS